MQCKTNGQRPKKFHTLLSAKRCKEKRHATREVHKVGDARQGVLRTDNSKTLQENKVVKRSDVSKVLDHARMEIEERGDEPDAESQTQLEYEMFPRSKKLVKPKQTI